MFPKETWWGFLIFVYLYFKAVEKDERYLNQELHKLEKWKENFRVKI